ncbi:MAG TPA: ABC transporter ATP-binding protein [Acidimicrobiia bacterium]|jgi:ABC-type branched-subunit amino acid transport system ATPase component
MALLEINGLSKDFGGLRAINGLDIHVDEGEIVSVIGPNGAGKTTFFNLITGMETPDEGNILFGDLNVVGLRPNQILQLGMARTFQNVRLFPAMTVLENVMVGQHCRTRAGVLGAIFKTPGQRAEEAIIEEKAKEVLSFFGTRLAGYRHDQLSMMLSYANRRRLEIARAMATEPRLLLLDEPTAGMNPRETVELTELIGQLRSERGFTIILIEHDMQVVRNVSDRVVVLDHGVKLVEGSYDHVSTDEKVIEAYLGRPAEREG